MKDKMAASYGSGLQSPPPIGRPVDRVFEEAQFTGEIYLNGRKLRDYPKICSKYDLSDTSHVDISRNRLTELPQEVCQYMFVEKINCYHNVIRFIPDCVQQLQALTHLNLSRNQLTVLPTALCELTCLEVLSASNNKLVSLPEEISSLERLMDLDVSCNEIAHLPPQIGDLTSLRCLNLRRNFLVELPVEISRLQLYRLDFSSNRIEKIPTVFRKMETLEQFVLDHNPLSSPPAYICRKGRQHIMKYLQIEAIKEDRKRGIMVSNDADMKRFVRKSLPPQQPSEDMRNMLGGSESKWKRHTVLSNDSGYSTTDTSGDRNGWHSAEGSVSSLVEYRHTQRAHSPSVSMVQGPLSPSLYPPSQRSGSPSSVHSGPRSPRELGPSHIPPPVMAAEAQSMSYMSTEGCEGGDSPPETPPTPVMRVGVMEDEFTRELKRQKADYERKKKQAEQIRMKQQLEEEEEQEKEERRRTALRLQEEQRAVMERQAEGRRQEETRRAEETRRTEEAKRAEELRRMEEDRLRREEEEAARKREEELLRLQESVKLQEEQEAQRQKEEAQRRLESKLQEEAKKNKLSNKRSPASFYNHNSHSNTNIQKPPIHSHPNHLHYNHHHNNNNHHNTTTTGQGQYHPRPEHVSSAPPHRPPPAPPTSLALHGLTSGPSSPASASSSVSSSSSSATSSRCTPEDNYILSEHQYRNALSTQSFKEQRRVAGSAPQYRRAASDGLRKPGAHTATSQVDNLNYINKNGLSENSRQSSASTTPSVSPSPSPRNSISHLAKPSSPSGSQSHIAKPTGPSSGANTSHLAKPTAGNKSSVPRANGPDRSAPQNQAVRRAKVAGDRSSTSSPVSGRSARTATNSNLRSQGSGITPTGGSNLRRSSNSSTTDDDGKNKKVSNSSVSDSGRLKTRLDEQKRGTTTGSGLKKPGQSEVDNRRINTRPPTNSYGGTRTRTGVGRGEDSNFTIRRRDEQLREESEQMERLRQTVESRLKVTLPDNLPEALRDGVVLCHLANQIRPRSVGTIHVPSPAVPKLTLAKCRRNVEYFLEACRKIGVDQEQLCGAQDIFEERGISRVAITVAALVAMGSSPRQSAV
ncbi:leucine-rich repeat and calponin homology domain-containing protein [Aplysia californica]|uniref:Leucine-rich repeat and calponin homology domain-containing protein n=1 Tax=Aplysia californica TaxID=6500 RepID=A0ABM1A7S0_APLCA|nr:leucine-rich repeat and calponin homology domain-containing protein [Aplysia californica]